MRYLLFAAIVFSACNNDSSSKSEATDTTVVQSIDGARSKTGAEIKNDSLIIPGQRIGKIQLGTDAAALDNLLGKPSLTDAAMGQAWLTWQGKVDEHNNPTELNIYTSYKEDSMSAKVVKLVHSTSSVYATEKNIHVYSALEEIRRAYPALVKIATYKHRDGRDIAIYASKAQGIAFEVAAAGEQTICTGIIIYEKGTELPDIYRLRNPQMKVEEGNQFS